MKITPDTNVHDLLSNGIELDAFYTLQEVALQIHKSGTVRNVGVFRSEVDDILYLCGMTDEEKKATVAGFLPPWFTEITNILKRVQSDLGLDKKEQD